MTAPSRSDHLIERAAARLSAGALALPDQASTVPDYVTGPVPLPGAGSASPAAIDARNEGGETRTVAAPLAGTREGTSDAQPPAIATVTLGELERAGLVVGRTARTRISEEYRIVVGRVMRATWDGGEADGLRNLLMITSARPGEGKSFTALNLAGSIAQNGPDKVLLVDVDSKPRSISLQLGLSGRQGFLDLVADPTLNPASVAMPTEIPNLSIVSIGTRQTEAILPSGSRPYTPVIERLGRMFPRHLVILDAPPCLSTSDPHTISPHVGQVVMVVEAERTQRNEVEAALDLVRVCPRITVLLNKVRLTTSNTFGAYDYYGSYT